MSYWETAAFRRLQRDTYQGLYEAGFSDLEAIGWEDGPLRDTIEASRVLRPTSPDRMEECMTESAAVAAAVRGIATAALDALDEPSIWRGLPVRARRWWRLQLDPCNCSQTVAARCVGASWRKAAGWSATIKARIAARSRAGR
jgi:hypothetical protein